MEAQSDSSLTPPRKDYRHVIVGFTLSLMMLLQVVAQGSIASIQASAILALVVIALTALSYRPTNELHPIVVALVFSLMVIILLGSFRSYHYLGASAFTRCTAVILTLSVGLLLARRKEHHLLERALPIYAVSFVLVLIYVLIDNDRHYDRLRGHLHPNLWAFIAGTAAAGVLPSRISTLAKAALIIFIMYMIPIEFQARGALIWATLTLILFINIYFIRQVNSKRQPSLNIAIFILVTFAALSLAMANLESILSDVVMVESTTRGLQSGLSGRHEIWMGFLKLFSESPIFGFGFDMSRYIAESYMAGVVAGDISSTHNSYLTILFDFGLLGASIYSIAMLLMILGVVKSKRIELAPFIMVYLLSGLTESRPLNVGNPSGFLFVLLIPYCASSAFSAARRRVQRWALRANKRETPSSTKSAEIRLN